MSLPLDFVVLDVETTGLNPQGGDVVIEIAAQKVHGRDVVAEYVSLVKTDREIPAEATKVHGITKADIDREGKDVAEVLPELLTFIGDTVIVGHNVNFDLGFINEHLKKLSLSPLPNQYLDTLEIAKRYLILASYRLSNVAAYLKVPQPSAHRALIDVITTREVFYKLIERAQGKK